MIPTLAHIAWYAIAGAGALYAIRAIWSSVQLWRDIWQEMKE